MTPAAGSSTLTPRPSPTGNVGGGPPGRAIFSVSCVSAVDCWAVGDNNLNAPGGGHALIDHWDGSRWSAERYPGPARALGGGLGSVSCFGASNCWAAGDGIQAPVRALHWNGSQWSLSAFAVPSGPTR